MWPECTKRQIWWSCERYTRRGLFSLVQPRTDVSKLLATKVLPLTSCSVRGMKERAHVSVGKTVRAPLQDNVKLAILKAYGMSSESIVGIPSSDTLDARSLLCLLNNTIAITGNFVLNRVLHTLLYVPALRITSWHKPRFYSSNSQNRTQEFRAHRDLERGSERIQKGLLGGAWRGAFRGCRRIRPTAPTVPTHPTRSTAMSWWRGRGEV